jgi:drug/metabolite transporter (DMT)-like permease
MAERSAEREDLEATEALDDGDNENEGAHLLENPSEEEEQQRARDWADNVQLSVQSLHFLLILAQFMFGSFHAVTSLALRMGNDAFVMACIRETVSVPLLVPLALLLEPSWPSFTPHLVARLLVLAFVSLVGVRLLVYVGIFYSSAEISSTLIQSSPIVTMLMCVANGTERLLINRQSGLCKLSSLLCCASATTLMAFWSGPTVRLHSCVQFDTYYGG